MATAVDKGMGEDQASKVREDETMNIYVSWKNLNFTVPDPQNKKESKVILSDLNGCVKFLAAHFTSLYRSKSNIDRKYPVFQVKPGELVAVIGPSGSGKSSFLNCIAGRNVEGITGDILVNDSKRPINFAQFTGYVLQNDLYFETLTVMETFEFTAALKLPTSLCKAERMKRINDIIQELDLEKCKNTIIGTIGKGISGGERRRLAIGLEILNKPSLLLLDEPTSGLDSASALMVGKILKRLAETRNITILCTVHQPRFSLASMFDKLYFLSKGHELYFGPSFSNPDCLHFFEDAGYKCPDYENPADFLLDLVNTHDVSPISKGAVGSISNKNDEQKLAEIMVHPTKDSLASASHMSADSQKSKIPDDGGDSDSRTAVMMKLIETYQNSEFRKRALDYAVPEDQRGEVIFDKSNTSFYVTPWYNQTWVIIKRSFLDKWRDPAATETHVMFSVAAPLLPGLVFWQIDLTMQSMYDRVSAIALIVVLMAFFRFDIINLFSRERAIFNREHTAGMYRPSSFFVGRNLSEIPLHFIFVWIMGSIAYWMYGLQNDAEKYLIFMLIMQSLAIAAPGFLLICSALGEKREEADLYSTLFILIFMLFDGNWVSLDKVPVYCRWIEHISCLSYASQAMIANEYGGLTFTCTQNEIESGLCSHENGLIPGEDVLYHRGLDSVDIGYDIMMLWVLAFAYRVVAFLGVCLLHRPMSPWQIIKNSIWLFK